MSNGLLVAGIVCMLAALAAAIARRLGARVPGLDAPARLAMLFALGLALALASIAFRGSIGEVANAPSQASADDSNTCVVQALTCLPESSGPVVFRDPAAANAAAARNVKDNLPETAARAAAQAQGASGKAAELCGVVASDETSPLAKHEAAMRLIHSLPGDGKATDACMTMASAFL